MADSHTGQPACPQNTFRANRCFFVWQVMTCMNLLQSRLALFDVLYCMATFFLPGKMVIPVGLMFEIGLYVGCD